jgi:hypothetical protein
MKKFDEDQQDHQRMMIDGGYQHYRYNCDNADNIVSITCLYCDATSVEDYDIDQQYCPKCYKYHFTPT